MLGRRNDWQVQAPGKTRISLIQQHQVVHRSRRACRGDEGDDMICCWRSDQVTSVLKHEILGAVRAVCKGLVFLRIDAQGGQE